jgi:hypothetical protein
VNGGLIDIVCNVFTPGAVRRRNGMTDETFKTQVRMPVATRAGLSISEYQRKMDRAGIERSLLIAVRARGICE